MPPAKKKPKSPSFEQALSELEDVVEAMEDGKIPLEELIAKYERGAELINHCDTMLEKAKKRIELITLTPKSSKDDTDDLTTDISQEDHDDEIRLF